MTIKQLLGLGADGLEKLTDEELLAYLKPHIQVVEALRPQKTSRVIDVSGTVERVAKKNQSVDDFIKEMTQKMMSKMEAQA
jgi:hypothetical protein